MVRGYGLRRCRYKGRSKTGLRALYTATACNLRLKARAFARKNANKREI